MYSANPHHKKSIKGWEFFFILYTKMLLCLYSLMPQLCFLSSPILPQLNAARKHQIIGSQLHYHKEIPSTHHQNYKLLSITRRIEVKQPLPEMRSRRERRNSSFSSFTKHMWASLKGPKLMNSFVLLRCGPYRRVQVAASLSLRAYRGSLMQEHYRRMCFHKTWSVHNIKSLIFQTHSTHAIKI